MSRFPTAGHLISWAGLCPRQDESAGKRRSTRLKKGAPWLKTALVQAAWAAARKKHGYFDAQFQRLRGRRVHPYHDLALSDTAYADLGPDHLHRSQPMNRAKALVRQIERLGFACALSPTAPVSV